MYLSSSLMVSEQVLKEIIEVLVRFHEFDAELWEKESILFNEKFVENVSDAYKKRNNNCIDRNSLIDLLISKGRIKHLKSNLNPQKVTLKAAKIPKGKKRKEKKIIIELLQRQQR
jgi:hypothetical protein